jgi:cytochrome c553
MVTKQRAEHRGSHMVKNMKSTVETDGGKARAATAIAFAALLLTACTAGQGENMPSDPHIAGIVHVCTSCHGFEGRSISPTFPRLAGQQQDYLEAQLKAFRDHTRADPHAHTYMWGMAGRLSDADIAGIAAYFSSQKPVAGTPGDPTLMAEGKAIFENGIPDRDVPACHVCHGDHGQGNGIVPRLAGQHLDYIEEQLRNFASNARANAIMHFNSQNLTPQEIEELATYVRSL